MFALSKTRGRLTKHPLDSWATICGWNFAKRNVKVELTQNSCKSASECKKCFKLNGERDGVRGAREWAHSMDL